LTGDGLIVAVLGADGSGKSTLVEALDLALSNKIDVVRLYLGSGDGPSSVLRWPVARLRRQRQRKFAARSILPSSGEVHASAHSALWHFAKEAERIYWATTLALEKRSKLRRAEHARATGGIVVTDRYPQTSIEGYNDGPLLGDLVASSWRLLRMLSRWERDSYGREGIPQPDLVLKLIGSPEVLNRRRPEMTADVIAEKQNGVLDIAFGDAVRVVRLDADRSSAEVLASAMAAVGVVLSAQSVPSSDRVARDVDAAA
jgi:thymidylate kinase